MNTQYKITNCEMAIAWLEEQLKDQLIDDEAKRAALRDLIYGYQECLCLISQGVDDYDLYLSLKYYIEPLLKMFDLTPFNTFRTIVSALAKVETGFTEVTDQEQQEIWIQYIKFIGYDRILLDTPLDEMKLLAKGSFDINLNIRYGTF